MLERGGNAFDAAVAAGFVLQVVEPHLNGPGGEVPILLYSAERDEVLVVDGQGTAPAAATIERFRELGHELVPGTGLLAACVPGAFDAWLLLLREFGTLPLADVLEPAIGYAESGYPLVPGIVRSIARMEQVFRDEWPALGGAVPARSAGRRALPQPRPGCDLSARARRVEGRARGRARGLLPRLRRRGDRRVRARCSTATTSPRGRRRSSSRSRAPTTAGRSSRPGRGARGRSSCSSSRCSTASSYGDRESPEFVHTVVECAKLAFADREAWYGDVEVPLDDLLSPAYAEERRKLVGEEASGELRPGSPGGREPRLPQIPELQAVEPGTGEPTGGDTCHVDVVDRFGNAVSATPSGGWLHGSPVIPGLGFCLGTRAQMFWLEEGLPSSLAPAQAAALDALAHARPPRRRAARLRHAGRRPPGPVVARLLPLARPLRAERPGGDRRADVPHRPLPGVVLPAPAAAACRADRGALRPRDARRARAPRPPRRAAGTRGRSGASAPPAGTARACSTRRQTLAACRATRSAASPRAGRP